MRVVVQRVKRAEVRVDDEVVGRVGPGLLVLLGAGQGDGPADVAWLVEKVVNLRVFEDDAGKMNRSLLDVAGALLVVSQFTLYGDCRHGRRPSFTAALEPAAAAALSDELVRQARALGVSVETGRFGAMMDVELVNDGPVTLLLDSQKTF